MALHRMLCTLGLLCLLAAPGSADPAYYLSSFGDGVPSVTWWTLANDGETVILSDGGLVREYALDGTALDRRFVRQPHHGELIAVASSPSGDLYLLGHYEFDGPGGDDVPGVERWGPAGEHLGMVAARGSGPSEFLEANDLAVAPDGSILVADLGNARIQRFSRELEFLNGWPASPSLLSRGFLGPFHIAVDQASRVWACYLPDSNEGLNYPIEVVVSDLSGQELHAFATTVEVSQFLPHWGDVVLAMGASSSDRVQLLCATFWDQRVIASCEIGGGSPGRFPVSGYATSASFAPDGRAVVRGPGVGFDVFSAGGALLHHWGDATWAFENNLLSAPQDIAFGLDGDLVLSGGDLPYNDAPGLGYIHRYDLAGNLEEVVVSIQESPWNYFYFALDLEGDPVPSSLPVVNDSSGNFYYLVGLSPSTIRKTRPDGEIVAEWTFGRVTAIAIGLDDLLYTVNSDSYGYWVEVRDLDGNLLRSFDVEHGGPVAAYADGCVWVKKSLYSPSGDCLGWVGHAGIEPFYPSAIAVNEDGIIAFACEGRNRVHLFTLAPPLFPDVPLAHWAQLAVNAVASSGIAEGHEDGLYHPEWPVTRDQMAVYISRALVGGDENIPPNPWPRSFGDVSQSHWAYDHIEYAKACGVVIGCAPGIYAPDLSVTRDQMAVFIARARGWVDAADDMTSAPQLFVDVPAGFWAGTAIEACDENDVVYGCTDGCYHPERVVTRDQMAVYIARAFELL